MFLNKKKLWKHRLHAKRNNDRKIICTKPGNEDFRKLLLVCLSESVLVVDQNLKKT